MNERTCVILEGIHCYPGATVWSNYHNKLITVTSIYEDRDGDVYLCFSSGNANVKTCTWVNLNETE